MSAGLDSVDSEWTALVAAICRSPADDLPRLVAADWLDERGESARAELIRVQCELDRLEESGDADPVAIRTLEEQVAQLLNDPHRVPGEKIRLWAGRATAKLIPPGADPSERLKFRRGFVSVVRTRIELWMKHGCSAVAENPLVSLRIEDRTPTFEVAGVQDGIACSWLRADWTTPDDVFSTRHYYLPARIFDMLPAAPTSWPGAPPIFERPAEARRALSMACLRWAHIPAPVKANLKWWGASFRTEKS